MFRLKMSLSLVAFHSGRLQKSERVCSTKPKSHVNNYINMCGSAAKGQCNILHENVMGQR